MNKIPCLFLALFLSAFALPAQPSAQPAPIRLVEPPRVVAPPPIRIIEAPRAVAPPELVAPQPFRPGQANPAEMEARKKKLQQSFQAWQRKKQECGGDYSYKKYWTSWVGFGHETTVIVEDNKVVARSFRSFSGKPVPVAPGQPPKPAGKTWTERGPEVGKNKQGHPPKTLDELYAEAKAIVHGPVPPFNRMSLRTDKNGLLLACYLRDTRIADDAPSKGVNITSITLGKKDTAVKPAPRPAPKPLPDPGGNDAKVRELEAEIARMKDFAKRARFTPDGHKKFLAKLAALEEALAGLKGGAKGVPTYEQWVAGGKKLPPGMMFIGGSPWFNERTGQKRQPREVYDMIYGKKGAPAPIKPKPIRPIFKPGPRKPFPKHWGNPPLRQTRDRRPLPGGYGMGSGTLAKWIQENLDRDKKADKKGD